MELTGKCKKDFEKYLNKLRKHETERNFADIDMIIESQGYEFYDLLESMKYGVYVDFFDSVGIYLSVSGLTLSKTYICDISIKTNVQYWFDGFNLRQGARLKAIEKANEIYNKI
jgi:hypothetical protein